MRELRALRRTFGVGNNPCLEHVAMIKIRHWLFCPHCGIKLQIIIHCDKCGRDFMSEQAFIVHNDHEHRDDLRKVIDEHCKKVKAHHRIVFMTRRGVYYCADCREEIKSKAPS